MLKGHTRGVTKLLCWVEGKDLTAPVGVARTRPVWQRCAVDDVGAQVWLRK